MSDRTPNTPPSSLSAVLLSGGLFLRVFLGRRRFWGLLLAACAPVGLALYGRLAHGACGAKDYAELIALVVLQLFGLGLSLLMGVAAVRDDREDRTLIYLWTRPVPRWSLLLGKLGAAAVLAALLLLVSTAASAAVFFMGCEGQGAQSWVLLGRAAAAVLMAAFVYTPLFALVAAIFRKPMVPAIILAFGWEVVVANLPGAFPRVTLMYYAKSLVGLGPESEGLLSMLVESVAPATALVSLLVLGTACLVFTAVGLVLASRRELP